MLYHFRNTLVGVSVSHVIKMAWERLPRLQSVKLNDLVLKVCGRDEYLDKLVLLWLFNVVYLCCHSDMLLSDYEYVHQCLKFSTDVHVTMVMLTDANKTFSYEVKNPLKLHTYYLHIYTLSLCLVCYCQRRGLF